MATLPSSESDFSELTSNIFSAQPIFTGLPVSRDFVAASASICALQPVIAVGRRLLAVDHRVDEGLDLVAVGRGIALEEEVLHRVGGEAAGAGELSPSSRARCRPTAGPSSRAPRCAGRSHRWRGANWRSGRSCRSRSSAAPPRCRRRRPCRSPDRPATSRARRPRPAPRRAGSAPCRNRGSSCRGTARPSARCRRPAAAPGSRDRMVTSSTSPAAPSASRFCSAAKFGSKRRLKPIISGMPAFSTRASVFSMRAELRSTGFSQSTALPAFAAVSMKSAWVSVGVRDQDRVDRLVGEDLLGRPDRRAGRGRQRLGAVRHRDRRSPPACARSNAAIVLPWIWPMRPAPSSAIEIMSVNPSLESCLGFCKTE